MVKPVRFLKLDRFERSGKLIALNLSGVSET